MDIKEKIKELPKKPGVYLFKDKAGGVLYVGKAANLRLRVGQYFSGADDRYQLPFLLPDIADVAFTVTSSELEALFLENTIIKQYLPPYNIKLRDDKNYAFITIDYTTEIPQIGYARKVEKNSKIKYLGPYSAAHKIKKTLDLVRKIFPYCSNDKVSSRPCFFYHLHRCPGVCIGQISLEEYGKQLERIVLFLSGKNSEVKKELNASMKRLSVQKKFEKAARLRDQLRALEILDERQTAIFPARVDWDFVSLSTNRVACINLFKIRGGKLIDKENFIFDSAKALPKDILQTFVSQYYQDTSDLPREIYLQFPLEDEKLIHQLLYARSKHKVPVLVPTRGKKLSLMKLGRTNAAEFLRKWEDERASNRDLINQALNKLTEILKLPKVPARIEGYDISNIQGTNPVGSMVVFEQGMPAKSHYRKFAINTKQTPDDFAMMHEMLSRRLARLAPNEEAWPSPDLLVIDGGKGQLGIAVKVLKEKNITIPVIGLAKRIEEIFVPGKKDPIVLDHSDPALQLLQRLRDEAHRFAITFHRGKRSKQAVRSALDDIKGVGPKTKKLLKQKFGTIAKIKAASLEELIAVVGQQKAQSLKRQL